MRNSYRVSHANAIAICHFPRATRFRAEKNAMAHGLLLVAYGIGETMQRHDAGAAVFDQKMSKVNDGLELVRFVAVAETLNVVMINQSEGDMP